MTNTRLATLSLLLLPTTVFAHADGHHLHSWSAGLLHPLLGLDHLLALIAGGFWLGQQPEYRLRLAAIFVVLLVVGIAVGFTYQQAQFEEGVIASLVVMGALVASAKKMRLLGGGMVLGAVALVHGFVHGTELTTDAMAALSFTLGLLTSSSTIFATAALLALRCQRLGSGAGAMLVGTSVAVFGLLSLF